MREADDDVIESKTSRRRPLNASKAVFLFRLMLITVRDDVRSDIVGSEMSANFV
jgi:hypothetical protein